MKPVDTPVHDRSGPPPESRPQHDHRGSGQKAPVKRTASGGGPAAPAPGELAPDFSLEDVDGLGWRLSDMRGAPLVLLFGSGTCPVTRGALPALFEVFQEYGDRTNWAQVYIREPHPGTDMPPHRSYSQKLRNARAFARADRIPWRLLVDRLDGAVHELYGGQPNPLFLLDVDGRVAFQGDQAHGPTLHRALTSLLALGGRGAVGRPHDRAPHPLGPTAYGWEAVRRGGPDAVKDLNRSAPDLSAALWIGSKVTPVLDPIARRGRPLSGRTRLAIGTAFAAVAVGFAASWRMARGRWS